MQWVVGEAGQNPTPDNAVECGYDGDYTTYVARAVHNGIDVPGKVYAPKIFISSISL